MDNYLVFILANLQSTCVSYSFFLQPTKFRTYWKADGPPCSISIDVNIVVMPVIPVLKQNSFLLSSKQKQFLSKEGYTLQCKETDTYGSPKELTH